MPTNDDLVAEDSGLRLAILTLPPHLLRSRCRHSFVGLHQARIQELEFLDAAVAAVAARGGDGGRGGVDGAGVSTGQALAGGLCDQVSSVRRLSR